MAAELKRATDVAFDAVHTTELHVRRIAAALSSAVLRVTREVEDLVWDFRDMAGGLLLNADRTPANVVDFPRDRARISRP